ncbi:hypothetical protein D3C71_234700 [compost metagenome]
MTKVNLTKTAATEGDVENAVTDEQQEVVETQTSLLGSLISTGDRNQASTKGNQKAATADLTVLATSLATDILADLDKAENTEKYQPLFDKSIKDNDSLDLLIETISPLATVDVEFLVAVGEEELDKMLRSQQSKRSRSKNKDDFKLEDYKTMLVAAIAEGLIRKAMGKPKGAGGATFDGSDFTEKQIEEFKADEEKLAKAIRNVQSKKSIAKSKRDHDEEGELWQHLLRQEAFLKNLRDNNKPVVTPEIELALNAKEEAEKLLASVEDPDNMSIDDAKALFEKLKNTLAASAPQDEAE